MTDLKGERLINEHNGAEEDGRAVVQVRATTKAHERALLFNTAAAGAAPPRGRLPGQETV